jgi:hypothetical protein
MSKLRAFRRAGDETCCHAGLNAFVELMNGLCCNGADTRRNAAAAYGFVKALHPLPWAAVPTIIRTIV